MTFIHDRRRSIIAAITLLLAVAAMTIPLPIPTSAPQSHTIEMNARTFGKDLLTNKGRRLDEAFRGLIMLTTAPLYMIVFMGPWATIKEAAYTVGSPRWWLYALTMIGATLALVPGIFYACAALAPHSQA